MNPITPLPVPHSAGILLYGGSFDPPHVAHVDLAITARDALQASQAPGAGPLWLVYVPAARSPRKDAAPSATAAQRIRMLELALEGHTRVCIWTDEIDRAADAQPSYWIDTVRRARSLLGERWLRFLIGADQAVAFDTWRQPREILHIAEPAIIGRGDIDSCRALRAALAEKGFWSDAELDAWAGGFVDVGVRRASSTAIRGGENDELAPAVADYLAREGLYR